MTERIPINTGFYIRFSSDGRALSGGRKEDQALLEVLFWLQKNQGHEKYELVQRWRVKKQEQLANELYKTQLRVTRADISAAVDKVARESKCWDTDLIELVRQEMFRIRGVDQSED